MLIMQVPSYPCFTPFGRNKITYCSATSMDSLLQRVAALRPPIVLVIPLIRVVSRELLVIWALPPPGVVKVNFDASTLVSSVTGFSFITRDANGEVLAATTSASIAVLSPVLLRSCAFVEPFI